MTWPLLAPALVGAPHCRAQAGHVLDSPRPHPKGHHHALCCRRPAPLAEKRRLFRASSPGPCSNISSSVRGMPSCLHEEFEEETTLPGLERQASADHWPESWRFRKEEGPGRWDAGYWRIVRLATLSKKLQNLNPVLQHSAPKALNRGRKKRGRVYFQKIAADQVKTATSWLSSWGHSHPQLRQ